MVALRGYNLHYMLQNKFGRIKNRKTTSLFLDSTSGTKIKYILLCWRKAMLLPKSKEFILSFEQLAFSDISDRDSSTLLWSVQTERDADFSGGTTDTCTDTRSHEKGFKTLQSPLKEHSCTRSLGILVVIYSLHLYSRYFGCLGQINTH